jgi:hypothetical protein
MNADPIIVKFPDTWSREKFHEFRHELEDITHNREVWFLSKEAAIGELPALDDYTDELADRVADRVIERLDTDNE